jgi:hypothetical protein
MELLDGKWFEKFFYLHGMPFWRSRLWRYDVTLGTVRTVRRAAPQGNIRIGKPGGWQARTVN